MNERMLCQLVVNSLKASGVPESAILFGQQIKAGDQGVFCADLIVVAEDRKSIIAVFEFRKNERSVERGVAQLRCALNLINDDFSCYIVTEKESGGPVFAMLQDSGEVDGRWLALKSGVVLVEDYEAASCAAICRERKRKNVVTKTERNWFVEITAVIGLLIVGGSVLLECMSCRELSWKVYAMIAMFYSFCAAACGYDVRLKWKDYEISIVKVG